MELSSIQYFSFWSVISILFSTTGLYALDKASIPVSDFKDFLEVFFPAFASYSISFAFLYRPVLELDDLKLEDVRINNKIFLNFYLKFPFWYGYLLFTLKWNYGVTGVGFWFVVSVALGNVLRSIYAGFRYSHTTGNFLTGFAGPLMMYPYHTLCWVLLQGFSLLFVGFYLWYSEDVNTPLLDLSSHINLILIYASLPSISLRPRCFKHLIARSSMAANAYKHKRIIEIVCGMLATTLAQYYSRLQSVALMFAFLSWACAWLGILANVHPCTDFGIFQFFLTSSLQFAVSLFGLHFYTFLVVLCGIVLTVLRWKMESVSLRHFGKQESVVRDWRVLEELYGKGIDSRIQTRYLTQPSDNDSINERRGNPETLDQAV